MIHAESVKAWEAESNDLRKIIGDHRRENELLRGVLVRARTVLANMALENENAIFGRWPIHHEPLRSDARNLLPVIDEVLKSNR